MSPNYVSSIFDCVSRNGWSSSWTLLALADVIDIQIKSVYPPMNSTQDFSFKSLNFTAVLRKCQNGHRQITIMWTRDGHHNPNTMWTPNHFVPLIPIPATISTVPSYAVVMKSQPPPSKSNISQQTSVPTTNTSNSTEKDRTEPFRYRSFVRRCHEITTSAIKTKQFTANQRSHNTCFQLYRKDRTDPFFGQSGLVDSTNRNDFECKAADISTKYPSFSGYFHTKLKD